MKNFLLKELIVWLIILTGLIVFSVFAYIIAVNKGRLLTSLVSYKTHLSESTGIYVGTKVTIQGANTGNVIKTTLLPNGNVEIRFSVRKSHAFGITSASRVQIKNSGALGDRFINIATKDISAPVLEKGSLIPYESASTLLSVLTEGGGEVKKSLQSVISQIDELLGNLNEKGASGLLSESQQEDISQILKSAKSILEKADSGKGTLGALINDRSLYNRLLILLGKQPKSNYLQELSHKSGQPSK